MRLLLIGDFHSKVPQKLKNKIKKEDFDYVLCVGDLAGNDKLRDLLFKNWEKIKKGNKFSDLIGKRRYDSLNKKTLLSIREPIKFLSNLGKKVILIYGNWDPLETRKGEPSGIKKLIKEKKNIILVHNRKIKIGSYYVLAFSGYRFPIEKKLEKTRNYTLKQIRKINKKWDNRLKKLFKNMENKNLILLTHDPPRNTKFDLVDDKRSPLYKKHIGDEYIRKYILKYKPKYHVFGHMHEHKGKGKLGKTTIINPGTAYKGEAAIFDLSNNKIKWL